MDLKDINTRKDFLRDELTDMVFYARLAPTLKDEQFSMNLQRLSAIEAEKAAEEAAKKEEGIKQQDKADSQGKENTPADQGWYQFETMLTYKMEWRKVELIEIGRFDPSSKMCSKCGNIKHDLRL